MSLSDPLLPAALSRRRLARLVAGAAAVPVVATALPPSPAGAAPSGSGGRVRLRRDPGSVVAAADVPLAEHAGLTRPAGSVRTRVIETTHFSMLGVTWTSGTGHVRARVRRAAGGWTGWQEVPRMHDGPDPGTDEGRRARWGTEPVWVAAADAVQVELSGSARDATLVLIDPGRRPEDARAVPTDEPEDETPARTAAGDGDRTPKPKLLTRRAWGADPGLRDGTQVVNRELEQVHIHHTVNSNGYARRDVPGLIRGMYRYHTVSLGWSDLGYNFLVDRFGRIWVGRKDSGRRLVRGAHTLGFNHRSMGVAVIGNFEVRRPNDKIIAAIVRLAAWRVDAYDLRPRDKIKRRSQGSDNYPPGDTVWLPVIDGHRDTNDTACPGKHLYADLPRIRRRVRRRIRRFNDR